MSKATPQLCGLIDSVCVGSVGELDSGRRKIESAFVKTAVQERVSLGPLGLTGDEHVYEDHGGPDMALLAYPKEHYDYWRSAGLNLPEAGAMAENLTTTGLVETEVCIGDVFEVGTCVVQVSETRSPCFKLAARFGRKDMAVLMQDTGYTGFLFRVLVCGELGAGDEMKLIRRDGGHTATVAEAGRVLNVDRTDMEGAQRLFAVPSLGLLSRRTLAARLEKGVDDLGGLHVERLFHPDDQTSSGG
ncbi:MAG: MOSC domain-containing protein YiiM [Verrucomicrobiales bacterium]|jgi:MOSC domain-containing protein YiiM